MELLIWASIALIIIGGLGFLIAAFKTSIIWGLAVLFIPPAAIVYLVMHWQSAKGAFQLQLLGVAILVGGSYFSGGSISASDITSAVPGLNKSSSLQINNDRRGQSAPWQSQTASVSYRCDGRVHCSQMTSCEEATFFLRNCPGTKMDGDGNGIPCERQWCRR